MEHPSESALGDLKAYAYPGNVRELKNILERAVMESNGREIETHHLHFFFTQEEANERTKEPVEVDGSDEIESASLAPEEKRVLDFIAAEGCVNNTSCRELLNVDRHRASYLLRKLEREGRLVVEGSGRWAQYRLP